MVTPILLAMAAAGGETAARGIGRRLASWGTKRKRAQKSHRKQFTYKPKGRAKASKYWTRTGTKVGGRRKPRSTGTRARERRPFNYRKAMKRRRR